MGEQNVMRERKQGRRTPAEWDSEKVFKECVPTPLLAYALSMLSNWAKLAQCGEQLVHYCHTSAGLVFLRSDI